MINQKIFFADIRLLLFKGKLSQSQVDGIIAVLNEWELRKLTDLRWLAYMLATFFHETGKAMQPVEENGRGAHMPYGKKLKYGEGPGKRVPYDTPDHIYYGRGPTQNTWYEVYERLTAAAKKQGYDWDFLNHPDLLLEMRPGIWAMFHGMTTGLYTGHKLSQYFSGMNADWINARKIINGTERAELIAGYAQKFYSSILKADTLK